MEHDASVARSLERLFRASGFEVHMYPRLGFAAAVCGKAGWPADRCEPGKDEPVWAKKVLARGTVACMFKPLDDPVLLGSRLWVVDAQDEKPSMTT